MTSAIMNSRKNTAMTVLKNLLIGSTGSALGIGLFLGGMMGAMVLLMVAGTYFNIPFVIDAMYAMTDFYTAVGNGTFSVEGAGMDLVQTASAFLMVSMCLGYVPLMVYMFLSRNKEGGYGEGIQVAILFKWLAIFYVFNIVLELAINFLITIPVFAAAAADLETVNLLATSGNFWLNLITTGILAPIAEEISLRYMVQRSMYPVGPKFAIFFSAITFGIMHMNLFQGVFAAIMGVLLGMMYYKTNNLWYCTIVHVVNNSLAVLISQMGWNSYMIYAILPFVFYLCWSYAEEKKMK